MTDSAYRHRILIVDKSGSIASILAGQQEGLGEFWNSEATVEGKATYSVWEFDDRVRNVCSFAPLAVARDYEIVPGGTTALYDAICTAFKEEGGVLERMPEQVRPADVTVVICTDGLNNSSARYIKRDVRDAVRLQRETYKWRIIYMGTNQNAVEQATDIGVSRGMTLNYAASDYGSVNTWSATSDLLRNTPVAAAAPQGQGYVFTEEQRERGESAESPDTGGN